MQAASLLYALIALVPLCGLIAAITPFVIPKSECFAVTVPESAQSDPRIRRLKRRYAIIVGAITVICTAATAVSAQGLSQGGSQKEIAFAVVFTVATIIPLVASFLLMLLYRARVQKIKAAEGWKAKAQVSAAIVNEPEAPKPLSLAWNLLYLPVVALSAGLTVALYPLMPDKIPMKMDFAGNVTQTADKSPLTMSIPLVIVAFLALCMVFAHWSICRSKPHVEPGKPATSAYAYGCFALANTIMLLASGLALCLAIGTCMPLSFAGIISIGDAGLIVVVVALGIVLASIVISLKYGQSGSRLFQRMNEDTQMQRDDDRFWKLGVFYANREDPSLFVPKRFSMGWTINWSRPAAWLILLGFTVVTIAFCVVVGMVAS